MRISKRFFSVHYPVMWRDVIKILESNINASPKLFADCTLGAGGHSRCILESFDDSYIVATDLDKEIIPIASNFLNSHINRISVTHSSYTNIFNLSRFPSVFKEDKKFDGIILDLGMSSFQLDSPERGFSLRSDGVLDMRFNRLSDNSLTAFKIINFASELEISEIFKTFGEEKDSKIAAEVICEYRKEQKIQTASQLTRVLNYAFLISKSINKNDSITRCFQALRIFVNKELENIEEVLKETIKHIDEGGVILVISFHSLEDSIVIKHFKNFNSKMLGEYKTWDPVQPGEDELLENPRSRSARLRYFIKKSLPTKFL